MAHQGGDCIVWYCCLNKIGQLQVRLLVMICNHFSSQRLSELLVCICEQCTSEGDVSEATSLMFVCRYFSYSVSTTVRMVSAPCCRSGFLCQAKAAAIFGKTPKKSVFTTGPASLRQVVFPRHWNTM